MFILISLITIQILHIIMYVLNTCKIQAFFKFKLNDMVEDQGFMNCRTFIGGAYLLAMALIIIVCDIPLCETTFGAVILANEIVAMAFGVELLLISLDPFDDVYREFVRNINNSEGNISYDQFLYMHKNTSDDKVSFVLYRNYYIIFNKNNGYWKYVFRLTGIKSRLRYMMFKLKEFRKIHLISLKEIKTNNERIDSERYESIVNDLK